MKLLALFLSIGLSVPAMAQVMAPTRAPAVAAPGLGKLFLPPEKRQSLDRQRQFNQSDDDGGDSETLRLDGVVQRSSGYNSIWINQRVQPQARPGTDAASSPVELEQGRQIRLQVGESINRSTQERKNVLPPNAIQPGTRR
ncbi:MAG TPA: hypothetical protein VN066_03315 [Rhodocyclaceae bacterium]|nr:hypothetical protein [Rhodocyclaceae bacterium]